MVVAKLEAYQKIPIQRDVKAYITSFIKEPGTAEQLIEHLQSDYKDTQLFNYALNESILYLQRHIVEERWKEETEKSELLNNWEEASFILQENYLNDIIQDEIAQYSEWMTNVQLDLITLKDKIYFEGDIVIIVPSLIEAKELIDSVLFKTSNQIERLEYIQSLLFFLRHKEIHFDENGYTEVQLLEIVPLIQLYDEFSFNLIEIREMLVHYQKDIYLKNYSKLTAPVAGNTFRWEGNDRQLRNLFDALILEHISPETNFDTFRLVFSATDIERVGDKIVWLHTNVKNSLPNRLSLKSLIYALCREGLIGRRYESNSVVTYRILEECFVDVNGDPFNEFRKSKVEFHSGSSKEILQLVQSIK